MVGSFEAWIKKKKKKKSEVGGSLHEQRHLSRSGS